MVVVSRILKAHQCKSTIMDKYNLILRGHSRTVIHRAEDFSHPASFRISPLVMAFGASSPLVLGTSSNVKYVLIPP